MLEEPSRVPGRPGPDRARAGSAATAGGVLGLQRSLGNRQVARILGGRGAVLQRMPIEELRLSRWYRVRGYASPLELKTKYTPAGVAPSVGFRLPGIPTGVRVTDLDEVEAEVDAPGADAAPLTAVEQRALTAVWDAEKRVVSALALLAAVPKPGLLTSRQQARRDRESPETLTRFRDGLAAVLEFMRTRLSGSAPAGLRYEPDEPQPLNERATTDRAARVITLHKGFFDDEDRAARANTLLHECVHAATGVDDVAYRTTRAFAYLTDPARTANPDSFVALVSDLEGTEAPATPSTIAQEGVDPVSARNAAFAIALAQHVSQRASYLLGYVAKNASATHISAPPHVKWFRQYVKDNGIGVEFEQHATLASTMSTSLAMVASRLAGDVTVVAVAGAEPDQPWEEAGDALRLTYFATPDVKFVGAAHDKRAAMLIARLLKLRGAWSPNVTTKLGWSCVERFEPTSTTLAGP